MICKQKPLLGKLPLWTPNPSGIPAPIGAWILNEGSGNKAFDLSSNGYEGTAYNAPLWIDGGFFYLITKVR